MLRQNNARLAGSASPLCALWSTERATAGKATATIFFWYDASGPPRKTSGPDNENSRRDNRDPHIGDEEKEVANGVVSRLYRLRRVKQQATIAYIEKY